MLRKGFTFFLISWISKSTGFFHLLSTQKYKGTQLYSEKPVDRNEGMISRRMLLNFPLPFLATLLVEPWLVLGDEVKLDREIETIFRKAKAEESRGNIDQALQLYKNVVKLAPTYPYAWSSKGNINVLKGNLDLAVVDYSQAINLGLPEKERWVVYLNRGTVYLAKDDPELALQDFNKAALVLKGKANELILQNRAQAFERIGDYSAAEKDYAAAIALKPGELQPFWLRYALVLFQLGKYVDALGFARRTLTRFPDELEVRAAVVAILFGSRGNVSKMSAFEAYNQAVEVWTNNKEQYSKDSIELITNKDHLEKTLHWPAAAVDSFLGFLSINEQVINKRLSAN